MHTAVIETVIYRKCTFSNCSNNSASNSIYGFHHDIKEHTLRRTCETRYSQWSQVTAVYAVSPPCWILGTCLCIYVLLPHEIFKTDFHQSPEKVCVCVEDTGWYFPNMKRDPGRYLHVCSESVQRWLKTLKEKNKILILITSSHSDYSSLVCEFILGWVTPQPSINTVKYTLSIYIYNVCVCRQDFKDIFDVIVTNALKPGFFSLIPQQRSFKTLSETHTHNINTQCYTDTH